MATKDYNKLMEEAAARGEYELAAQYEKEANSIGASNSNKYSGWLDSTDYGTIGQQQMAAGANWQDVLDTYNNRLNKASGTVGMEQYINDDIQQSMLDYITKGKNSSFNYDVAKPTYSSQYGSQIDAMLNQILNREKFSYDADTDPLYQQYKKSYNREGDRSMRDTLAAVAAGAGGMNSYAVTAAQQANDYYAAQLADKIPELYQLAYGMYMDDLNLQVQDLSLLRAAEDTNYSRYRDSLNDWSAERDFQYGVHRDTIGDDRYADETAYNRAMDMLTAGVMPDASMLEAAGISADLAQQLYAKNQPRSSTIVPGEPSPRALALDKILENAENNTEQGQQNGIQTSYSAFTSAVKNAYDRGEITKAEKDELLSGAKQVKYWGLE